MPPSTLSKVSKPAQTAPAEPLRISVVIASGRRAPLLRRCLAAVCAQRLEPDAYEVIVVDDGADAGTRAVVGAFAARRDGPLVRLVRPRDGRGAAIFRDVGWRAAYARLIAFVDAATVPDPDWLAAGERALAHVDDDPWRPDAAHAFMRRSALLAAGGFEPRHLRAGVKTGPIVAGRSGQ